MTRALTVGLAMIVGVGVAYLAGGPPPTIQDCLAQHGYPNAVVDDNGIELTLFTRADNNAGQAWQAQADHALDTCVP